MGKNILYENFKSILSPLRGFGLRRFWIVRRLLAVMRPGRAVINGYMMYLDRQDFTISEQILKGEYEPFETELFCKIIKPKYTIIDLGANIGYYTLLFSKLSYSGIVFAFEPSPRSYRILMKNIAANGFKKVVHPFQHAIGDHRGKVNLFINEYNRGDNRISRSFGVEGIEASIDTLDNIIPSTQRIDLIKMDIQGAEVLALRGMQRIISDWHPTIVSEFDPHFLKRAGTSAKEFFDILSSEGYLFDMIDEKNRSVTPISPSELLAKFPDISEGAANLVCHL